MSKNSNFQPRWASDPPPAGSYRSIFKWGDPAVFKHPNKRLYRFIKDKFHLTDADFVKKNNSGNMPVGNVPPSGMTREQIEALIAIVGPENVMSDDYSRVKYASGKTMEEALCLRKGINDAPADLVVHPRTREDVRRIVTFCTARKLPLYVFGGGSSVNFGFRNTKGGVTLVMNTHMRRVLAFSEKNQTITVEPGIMGPVYEKILNQAPEKFNAATRYTGGHFPQSFEYSTVGGWIAALGSGQESSCYGDMYDIVLSQEYVTPAGIFKTLDFPGTATGPRINDIMKGSEGAFGVMVAATLKIFRHMPENRQQFAFVFPDWEKTVTAAREICQSRFGMPSVFRISDPEETDVALKLYGIEGTMIDTLMRWRGFNPMQRCLFIGRAEGEKAYAVNIKKRVKKTCRRHKGMYITGYPVNKWEQSRYLDPYMREDLNDFGILIDTLESGVTWDNFHNLHRNVRAFIKERPATICMTHASHFYPQGTNLYFIFIVRMNDIEKYREFQKGIIDRIQTAGGSLSHHHGIGKMIAPWMEQHLGKTQMDILRALKNHFDPDNIMNPGGTLGLDLPGKPKRDI
ncbi:MAG: FAD-binding oxidoreductase [Deltaproteobacteria bacterium]|nr:FAD-binding oxidoreductase [Deltaproteobacteria bacterium]